ncbi:MAG: ribokinase [Rhizobiales bacterium PAR1]|nr:MAG: ribokinase [Rhizobiales bacterium PAR1]
MGRVLVLGSINRDLVIGVAAHPRPGETVSGTNVQEFPGGKGANQAVAARRAGADSLLVGATGADGFGTAMRAFLSGEGIDLTSVITLPEVPTGIAVILVDRNAENTVTVAPGANAALKPADLAGVNFQPGDHVVSQFEVPEAFIAAGFEAARAAGGVTIFNPAPMKALSPALLGLCDIVILNETELEVATGKVDLTTPEAIEAAARSLATGTPTTKFRTIIVTLGAKGCIAVHADGLTSATGEPVRAVDTTGAGDCFVGVLAAGLAEGLPLETALRRANRAAAISVTRQGAASSMPLRAEFE